MADAPVFILPTGQTVRLGYRRRTFEPASVKYNFTNWLPRTTVDLNQPRMFWLPGGKTSGTDPRLPIKNQLNMGSCVSFGVLDAVTALMKMTDPNAVELMHDWGYEMARKKEGTFPQDAGSDPGDMLDLCLSGVPAESLQAGGYVDNPAATFDQYTPQATNKYIQSFHPMYPTDSPNLQTLVWQALDAGYVVNVATLWTNACFNPVQGILPSGQTPAQEVGGHDIYCWGIVPGYFLCDNSWDVTWSADAAASGFPFMRPGSFAIPWAYGAAGSLIEQMHAIVPVSAPAPQPTPTPTPVPSNVTQAQVDGILVQDQNVLAAAAKSDSANGAFYSYGANCVAWTRSHVDVLYNQSGPLHGDPPPVAR